MTHEYILTRDILRSNPPTRPRKPIESLSQVGGVWKETSAGEAVEWWAGLDARRRRGLASRAIILCACPSDFDPRRSYNAAKDDNFKFLRRVYASEFVFGDPRHLRPYRYIQALSGKV